MDSDSIGIAIIGTGRAGMIHAGNFARNVKRAHVAALAGPVPESLQTAQLELGVGKTYTDYRRAIEELGVHAIVIAKPTSLHREITEAAAAAGKHVFCEKPMAMREEECDAMVRATEAAGVVLQIGFMRRFDRSFRDAKARIEQGEIGEVVQVKTHTHGPSYPRPWMFDLARSNASANGVRFFFEFAE